MAKPFTISMNLAQAVYDATRNIEKYDHDTRKAIQDVIQRGTHSTLEEAVKLAPYGATGNLKAGITEEFKGGMYARGKVKSTAPHSHLVEFGSGPRIVAPKKRQTLKLPDGGFVKGDIYNGKMPKAPFMRPAAEKTKPMIEHEMEEVLSHDTRS